MPELNIFKLMTRKGIHVVRARILVSGLTFKENCPDLRNSRVVDTVRELWEYNVAVGVYDPCVSAEEPRHEYGFTLIREPKENAYDGIVVAVAHREWRSLCQHAMRALGKAQHVLFDLKYVPPATASDLRL